MEKITAVVLAASLRAQIADETGINGIAIRLTALNPDGTVLYSRDFTE